MKKAPAAAIIVVGCVLVGRGQPAAPRAVRLTLHEGTNMAAAVSPDGRTIAIDLLGTLWTMPAQGGTATAITDIFLDARQPSWSPDGRRIAFASDRAGSYDIWVLTLATGVLRQITTAASNEFMP